MMDLSRVFFRQQATRDGQRGNDAVGALIERPPELTASQFCHCEPVTDVTGVAIRFPLRSDHRLRCVLWQAGMPAGGLTF